MATILSLALKVNADASGVVKNLTPAERALEKLAGQAGKATSAFDALAKDSRAAADAQAALNQKFEALAQQLQGGLNAQEYANQFALLQEEVRKTSAAFADGARVTEQNKNAQELHAAEMERLNALVQIGAISEETYSRAVAKADASLQKASVSADKFADQTSRAAESGLKFNEISGILSALPGPLGNIAGRFSGITSAAEGLQRVFAGNISANLSAFGSAAASLVNPFTAAAAAATAFGAGAVAVIRNLVSLEAEVERLGQLANRLGVSFEFIQVLEVAAVKTGTSVDALGGSFNRFLKSIDDARSGSGDAVAAFQSLGISIDDLRNTTPDQLFTDVAGAVAAIQDPAERAAAAMRLFGKAGAELLPVFDELATARQELERLGSAISDRQRQDIERFGNELDRASIAAKGFSNQSSAAFASASADTTRAVTELIAATNRFSQQNETLSRTAADSVANSLPVIGKLRTLGSVFGYFSEESASAADSAKKLAQGLADIEDASNMEGLQKLFDNVRQSVSNAIDESAQFGQAGLDAAYKYQEAIDQLRRDLDAGLFNEETFRRSAQQAGNAFKDELAQIEADAELEIRVKENAAAAIASIREQLSNAIDESAAFGEAGFDAALKYQAAINELQRQFEAGIINEETLSRGAEAAQAAYEAQVQSVKKLADEQRKLIENDRDRIDALLNANDASTKLEQDLQAVQREQARVSAELAAAREADNVAQADAAAARQGELDQLQAKLEEQQQALEQGFGQGFDAAFQNVNESINGLINKSAEFGQAGFAAAAQLQEGIALAQQQAKDGILNAEAFQMEVDRQKALFEQELKNIDEAEKAWAKAADDRAKAEDDRQKALLKAQDEYRKQQQSAMDAYAKQQQQAQEAYAKEQQRIFEEQRKAAEAEAKRQEERLAKLNTLGAQSLSVADIRNTEGANLVLQLAANAQDPRLIQERMQTKLLERIALGIGQAASNYFNQPVAIVGGSMTLDPRAQQNVRL